jgi:hypothetical protein
MVRVFWLRIHSTADVYYEKNKKSDRELEQILIKDSYYRENIITSQERRAELQNVFNNMVNPGSDVDLERRMMEAFHGGRSDQKRLYPVNKTLYGTEQGVAEKQRAVEESMRKEEERKTRRRNRKHAKSTHSSSDKESIQALGEMHENDATLMKERNSSHNMDPIKRRKRWIVAGTAVTAFVTIGVIVIGRPRSS